MEDVIEIEELCSARIAPPDCVAELLLNVVEAMTVCSKEYKNNAPPSVAVLL